MKKSLKIISLLLTFVIISLCVSVGVSADSSSLTGAPVDEDMYLFDHTAEFWFRDNSSLPELYERLQMESVDGVDYIFIVEDDEAYILNVHYATENRGVKNRTLVLPDLLGGCYVTALGYPNAGFEIFRYISYGETLEDFEYHYPYIQVDYPDYDPEIQEYGFVEKLVFPNGCKYIYKNALNGYCGAFEYSKSLRFLDKYGYSGEYITGVDSFLGENTFITPDCEFGTNFFYDIRLKCDNYICQSRFPSYTFDTSYSIPKAICVPYNVTAEQSELVLFKGGAANQLLNNTVIYCADDSPTYEVIQANKALGEYQVVTDIPKAEYIAFPSETVNVNVGEVMDLEAKTYPTDAIWTACDYTVSDPSIVKIDEYSGRITALKEGTVTVTATHCERGYVDTCTVNVTTKPEPGVNGVEPATETPYVSYGNRDYNVNVTGSPSKIQVIRDNGGTTTIDRRKATITSNGDTETWLVNMRVEAGTHNIRVKYGNVWDDKLTPFTVEYDLPGAYSFDLTCENGIGTFEVVTDPEVTKIQFALDNGCTLTYSQSYSYIGEDGLRHWTMIRQIPSGMQYTLKTKYGYTWTTTDFTVTT